jgi:hypothetical protein
MLPRKKVTTLLIPTYVLEKIFLANLKILD